MTKIATAFCALLVCNAVVVAQNATAPTYSKEKPANSGLQAHFIWARMRLDEMDATLAAWEGQAVELQGDARAKAERALADMGARRDAFRATVKKEAEMTRADWERAKSAREKDWRAFEASLQEYLDETGANAEQLMAAFQARADAQQTVWQETIEKLQNDAVSGASAQKVEVDAAVKQMKADADAAKAKFDNFKRAHRESWSDFRKSLAEARAAFDRANQAAHDAFAK